MYEPFFQLFLAAVLGAFIGAERSYFGKQAGLRTFALVTLGSCLFTAASIEGFGGYTVDVSRVASQIVVGVGFLGAGVIIFQAEKLRGLTTAAALWAAAAVGMTVGLGLYTWAIFVTILVIMILTVLPSLESRIRDNEPS